HASLDAQSGPLTSAAFSPSGAQIVTAGADGTARVWDAETGRELRALLGHTGGVTSGAFSPGGVQIVTASGDGTARVWDAKTAKELLKLDGYTDVVTDAALSHDGHLILTTSGDGVARLDYATFEDVLTRARQLTLRPLTLDERKTYLGAP